MEVKFQYILCREGVLHVRILSGKSPVTNNLTDIKIKMVLIYHMFKIENGVANLKKIG